MKRQSYASWRATYQDPEHAARAAYNELMEAYDALEYYADRNKYRRQVGNCFPWILSDFGKTARKALEIDDDKF